MFDLKTLYTVLLFYATDSTNKINKQNTANVIQIGRPSRRESVVRAVTIKDEASN